MKLIGSKIAQKISNLVVYNKRYAVVIFVLFNKPEHAQFFLEYVNKKHKSMKFSIENEING